MQRRPKRRGAFTRFTHLTGDHHGQFHVHLPRRRRMRRASTRPSEIQQLMQKWMDWIGEGFAKGWMVDAGDALKPGGADRQRQEGRLRRPLRRVEGSRRRLLGRQGRTRCGTPPSSPRAAPTCSRAATSRSASWPAWRRRSSGPQLTSEPAADFSTAGCSEQPGCLPRTADDRTPAQAGRSLLPP